MADAGAKPGHLICASHQLQEGGKGLRFSVHWGGESTPAFLIRYRGNAHAYLNKCAHQAVELDWNEGDFFDRGGHALICATHGARYYPDTGECAGGRCDGRSLVKLEIEEEAAGIFLITTDKVHLA